MNWCFATQLRSLLDGVPVAGGIHTFQPEYVGLAVMYTAVVSAPQRPCHGSGSRIPALCCVRESAEKLVVVLL